MGKSTINGVFSIATLNYQRVVSINIPLNHYKIPLKHHRIQLDPIFLLVQWVNEPTGPIGERFTLVALQMILQVLVDVLVVRRSFPPFIRLDISIKTG